MESHNHFSPHVDEPVFQLCEECLIKNEEIEEMRERIRELEEQLSMAFKILRPR